MKANLAKSDFAISWWQLGKLKFAPRRLRKNSVLRGKRIQLTDPYWYLFSHHELLVNEIYKFDAERPDPLIIDCGANIGLSVIYFKYLYPRATIVAFEPDQKIFRVLE